jgi:hypothetical protein
MCERFQGSALLLGVCTFEHAPPTLHGSESLLTDGGWVKIV